MHGMSATIINNNIFTKAKNNIIGMTVLNE